MMSKYVYVAYPKIYIIDELLLAGYIVYTVESDYTFELCRHAVREDTNKTMSGDVINWIRLPYHRLKERRIDYYVISNAIATGETEYDYNEERMIGFVEGKEIPKLSFEDYAYKRMEYTMSKNNKEA